MPEALEKIAARIRERSPGVALTGSGVSAESGISTYRDEGGLWDSHPRGASGGMLGVLAAYPEKAPEILSGFFRALMDAEPNPGHKALAGLETAGVLAGVITQNVDNLHVRAGSRNVYELHGNMFRLRCLTCGKTSGLTREDFRKLADRLVEQLTTSGLESLLSALPKCHCGGVKRPDFVSFGEPVQKLPEALELAAKSGFVLTCGTSGLVHPAASIPAHAKARGAYLVEVNVKPGELTPIMDDFVEGRAGEVLPRLLGLLDA